MNSSVYRFMLDLHTTQSQISLPVTQWDTAREFHISLADGGLPFIITDGCLAAIEIKRPTGTFIQEFCAIENNTTVIYKFSQNTNTAALEGVHECDVILYDADGGIIGTARFTMVVSARVVNRDDINISDEDKNAIDAMISKEAARQNAEVGRVNSEASRASAETSRINAEASRVSAETSRVDAENERVSAEQARATAESERVETMERLTKAINAGAFYPKYSSITLRASAWVGTDDPYSQKVTIQGVTAYSKVDLLPSVEQLAIFHDKDIAFVTENENGTVTVYCIGDKPKQDYTIEVCITEVNV